MSRFHHPYGLADTDPINHIHQALRTQPHLGSGMMRLLLSCHGSAVPRAGLRQFAGDTDMNTSISHAESEALLCLMIRL